MLLSGIYAAEFISNLSRGGTGVAVFTDNTIHGGDHSHFYKGKYSRHDPDLVEATVQVAQHSGASNSSVVGIDHFRLKLTGKISEGETTLTLEGLVEGDPSRKISIKLRKLDDLVEG